VSNTGTQPLSLTAAVEPLEWIIEAAGEPGAVLYDLSAIEPLSATDDSISTKPLSLGFSLPVFGAVIGKIYVSSNGWVSGRLPNNNSPFASCLPNGSLPPLTLAPFWTDLDPSAGGAIRAGQVDSDTFVVSFEAVPLWQQEPIPPPPTYTFQVALHATGQAEFLYGEMGVLPARWSAGLAHSQQRGQGLACYKAPAELSGHLWRMYNQPEPALWLEVEPAGQWVAPGATAVVTAHLHGQGYAAWHPDPFLGPLRLTTNDPAQPTVTITATAQIGPAANSSFLPIIEK
jgi:hypothetical protein